MIRFILVVSSILLIGCTVANRNNLIVQTIDLKNDLGKLEISIPPEFDTFYSWTNYSDNECSDLEMFRFSNRDYNLYKESGFFYSVNPDTIYQLTISQPTHIECGTWGGTSKEWMEKLLDKQMQFNLNTEFVFQEIRSINNQEFVIMGYEKILEGKNYASLEAWTIIKDQLISITFICRKTDCKEFIKDMNKCLNTIEIISEV